jgi:hypothetical protein
LSTFADINNDRYTDIITINEAKTTFTVHIFEPPKKMFVFQKTYKPSDCTEITNIAVGRSADKLRVYVTCQTLNTGAQTTTTALGSTVIKIFDKINKYLDL